MTKMDMTVNKNTIAVLKNVTTSMVLLQRLIDRGANLPGIGVFSGPSGDGKSTAAQFAQNRLGAVYIEVRDYWTKKKFCEALYHEVSGLKPRGTVPVLMDEIIKFLGDHPQRPLIIDEADKMVDKGFIELIRDIYETTQVPVLLIGEELLPQKLQSVERVHNRVLAWEQSQPCDLEDTRALANIIIGNKLDVSDELLESILHKCGGRARRIATTLHEVTSQALNTGDKSINIQNYAGPFSTGETPMRQRRAV